MSEQRCPTCGSSLTRDLRPVGRLPKTVAKGLAVKGLDVVSWHDTPEPVGRAVAVALLLDVDLEVPLVVRIKSAAAVDGLIKALQRHAADVWPGGS